MASVNSNMPHSMLRSQSDYFDIIDVIGFIWRAKAFVILGVILSVAVMLGYVNSRRPPMYVTTLPVNLEVAGGTTPSSIIAKFNDLISGSVVQAGLTSRDVGFVGGKPPFKLINERNSFLLEVQSFSPDPSGDRALNSATAIYELTRDLNKKAAIGHEQYAGGKAISDLEVRYAQLASAQMSEEARLRVQLFAMEAKLAQKAGSRPLPAAMFKGTAIGDDVLRLLATAEGKLSAAEKEEIIRNHSDLTGKIKAIQAKYEKPLKDMKESISSAGVLSDVIKEGYPELVVERESYKSLVLAGIHERHENKRPLFILLGAIVGVLLGLMTYSGFLFFRANLGRLKAIF